MSIFSFFFTNRTSLIYTKKKQIKTLKDARNLYIYIYIYKYLISFIEDVLTKMKKIHNRKQEKKKTLRIRFLKKNGKSGKNKMELLLH